MNGMVDYDMIVMYVLTGAENLVRGHTLIGDDFERYVVLDVRKHRTYMTLQVMALSGDDLGETAFIDIERDETAYLVPALSRRLRA